MSLNLTVNVCGEGTMQELKSAQGSQVAIVTAVIVSNCPIQVLKMHLYFQNSIVQ